MNIIQKRTLDNPLESIEKRTGLSRETIGKIFIKLSNKDLYTKDPEKYISDMVGCINSIKDRLSIDEILYHST